MRFFWVCWGFLFTGPTTNVLAISVQLQHLDIKFEYSVIIADNGAPKRNEAKKQKQTIL